MYNIKGYKGYVTRYVFELFILFRQIKKNISSFIQIIFYILFLIDIGQLIGYLVIQIFIVISYYHSVIIIYG